MGRHPEGHHNDNDGHGPVHGAAHGGDPAGHAGAGHGGHGHAKHKHGHGDHGGHGGGGHGGGWIVTYCDMVTLLIACFICIITFSSKESEHYKRKRDSIHYGTGGLGIAGLLEQSLDRDAVVWRDRYLTGRHGKPGSEIPPMYSDPALGSTAAVLRSLEEQELGKLSDSYATRVPLSLFFDAEGRLSQSGRTFLGGLANNLRNLPYDVHIQVEGRENARKAVDLAFYLAQQRSIHPGRLGVGTREGRERLNPFVWFLLVRNA